ncbi:hypothetical protein ABZ901_30580, partial [Actinacidiphila alni]
MTADRPAPAPGDGRPAAHHGTPAASHAGPAAPRPRRLLVVTAVDAERAAVEAARLEAAGGLDAVRVIAAGVG